MQKLRSQLKKICKEKIVIDVVLFGSSVKEKAKPKDVDITIIFREENYKEIDRICYEVKKIGDKLKLNLHIEPFIIDSFSKEPLFLNLMHEGYSIKLGKFISESLKTESRFLISYSLENLSHSQKTLFGYALKGRTGQKGILQAVGGEVIGRNSIIVPTKKSESIIEFMKSWNIEYKIKRILVL